MALGGLGYWDILLKQATSRFITILGTRHDRHGDAPCGRGFELSPTARVLGPGPTASTAPRASKRARDAVAETRRKRVITDSG